MRQSWTDDRLDDFRSDVDKRFDQVDKRFDTLERRMDNGFNRIEATLHAHQEKNQREFVAVRAEMNERFEAMMDRLYSMQRLMIQFCGGALAALIGLLVTRL